MFPGFNNSRKRSSISNGDWDRDGVKNKKDCEPLNFRKQGPSHQPRCGNCGKVMPKSRESYGECEECVARYDAESNAKWDSWNQWHSAKRLGDDIRSERGAK